MYFGDLKILNDWNPDANCPQEQLLFSLHGYLDAGLSTIMQFLENHLQDGGK